MKKVLQILYSGLGGHASVVFALKEGEIEQRYAHTAVFYGNLSLVPFYGERCAQLKLKHHSIKKLRGLSFWANRELLQVLKKEAPEVIILHIPQLINAVSTYKRAYPSTKVIAVEHHPNVLKRTSDWKRSASLMEKADTVVFLTQFYADQVRQEIGNQFNTNKAVVIANGVNTNTFAPDLDTHELPVAKRIENLLALSLTNQKVQDTSNVNLVIGMCTRLSDQKDIDTLLHALHALCNADTEVHPVLFLAGDGPHRAALEKLSTDLALTEKVFFLGMLEERLLTQFYNNLDLYVHATLAETMSTSVMQAMAVGLPVIASDIAGMDVLIAPNTNSGKLVTPGDAAALEMLIFEMAQHKEQRSSLGQNARQHTCTNFSHTNSWDQYEKLFTI